MADTDTLRGDEETAVGALVCEVCGEPSPEGRFCSWLHTAQGIAPTLLVEIDDAPDLGAPRGVQSREGWVLDAAKEFDVYDLWVSGVIPDDAMASMIEARVGKRPTENTVFRSRQAGKEQRGLERISETWTMDGEVAHYIATDVDYLIRQAITDRDADTLNVLIDDLVDRFVTFRDRYFTLGRDRPYVTAGFHREWIASILRSYYTGGKTLILSPPRHGKSELLVHFIVWAIVRNPDIRVAWIAGNADVAGDMVSSVRNHLEHNERLIAETLPDGVTYAPRGRGSGALWGGHRFRVNTTTVVGQKAPTVIGVGRQGKVLSRDMDLIIADDIEDHQSTAMPSARTKTRHWWSTQVSSRKEEHTGLVIIGSRQHYEDLYGFFLGGKDEIGGWETIVNPAHDPLCEIDEHDYDAHVECMLFPEIRSYRWLLEKKTENRLTETGENFDMVYMNDPLSDAGAVFTPQAIDAAKNPQRSIGKFGIPDDVALVAGLDPATTGYQAAFLWGYHAEQDKLYMIDAKNERGGGIKPALKLIADWHREYRLTLWVVETNGWQKALIQSEEIRNYCEGHGIRIMPHETTGASKWDPLAGVSAMAIEFDHGRIDLPYANVRSTELVDEYARQLLAFRGEPGDIPQQRRDKSDVLMASWFPWTRQIRRWRKNILAGTNLNLGFESSYPSMGGQGPWGQLNYPAGTSYPGARR